MAKKNADHVILDYDVQPPVLRCTGCECERPWLPRDVPCPVDVATKYWEAFADAHKDCKQ